MAQSGDDNLTPLLQQYMGFFENMMKTSLGAMGVDTESEGGAAEEAPPAGPDVQGLLTAQMRYFGKQAALWQSAGQSLLGGSLENVVSEAENDRRFADPEWQTNPLFSLIRQSYLLNCELLMESVESLPLEAGQKAQLMFFLRQYINALSPTNAPATNPEVIRKIFETQGGSLQQGMENFYRDFRQSAPSPLKISQTDHTAFGLGVNVATTPGSVVYENEIMQLIQYAPSTDTVFSRPLLITPPYINKFYVLDLNENNSLIRWLVSKGFTVFVISWVNPDKDLAHKSFADYVTEGPLEALPVVSEICGNERVNLMGYCVGGTLAALAACLDKARSGNHLESLTLLTTLLDFEDPGELGHFLSPGVWQGIKQQVRNNGFMDGHALATSFSLLRENQLYWPYYINNYLKGETPAAFDILYWNSDSTHIPATNYIEYIETTYLDNALKTPGAFQIDSTPIDLSTVTAPMYCLATHNDHIVLWESAYQSAQLLSGPRRFVLGGSGHLAGVINPEGSPKYGYWTNSKLTDDAADWLTHAKKHDGSWWPDWYQWARDYGGDKVAARVPGAHADYPVIEAAPGRYVQRRL